MCDVFVNSFKTKFAAVRVKFLMTRMTRDIACFRMCLIVVSVNQRDDLPFVCMHNRDEDLSRATVMPDPLLQPEVIFGSDKLFPGSTWMGLNRRKGYFACLNNVRSKHFTEPLANRTSRGLLVQTFLTAPFLTVDEKQDEQQQQLMPATTRAAKKLNAVIQPLGGQFPGFSMLHCNLFTALPLRCMLLSNRPHPPLFGDEFKGSSNMGGHAVIPDGCHAMSNSFFDDFSWPKVSYIRKEVNKIIAEWPPFPTDPSKEEAAVLAFVSSLVVPMSAIASFDSSMLPDLSFSPLDAERESANQRVFIPHNHGKALPPLEASGTRSQTLVLRTRKHVYFFCRSTDDFPNVGEWIYSRDIISAAPSSVELAPLPQFLATGKPTVEAGV